MEKWMQRGVWKRMAYQIYSQSARCGVWRHLRQGKPAKGDDAAGFSGHRFYRNRTKQTSQNVMMSKQLKATAAVVGGVAWFVLFFLFVF